MAKCDVVIEIPEGYRPKYTDYQGRAIFTSPNPGDLYLAHTYRQRPVARRSTISKTGACIVLEKEETYEEKMRRWWPPFLKALCAATDANGKTWFYSSEPHIVIECWANAPGGIFLSTDKLALLDCEPPPEFKGDWAESLVRNPHL